MIEAMRLGAYDYITKPLDLDEIVNTLHRAAEQRSLSLAAEASRSSKRNTEEIHPDVIPNAWRYSATAA
jgi:two-component system response regulator AtoC